MRFINIIIFTFFSFFCFAQDTIITNVNDTMLVYIQSISKQEVIYTVLPTGKDTDEYKLSLSVIKLIRFEKKL